MSEDVSVSKAFFKDSKGAYQAVSVQDVQLPDEAPLSPNQERLKAAVESLENSGQLDQAASPDCDHHWISHHNPNLGLIRWVQTCSLCREVNWADLKEEIQRWREGLHTQQPLAEQIGGDLAEKHRKNWEGKERFVTRSGGVQIPANVIIQDNQPPVNNVLEAARAEHQRRLMHEPWLRNG